METRYIDRYEVRAEIGKGGMASVLRCYDPRFDREVAVKILPKELLHNPTFRTRFDREARVIASLEHSAIVPVYDFGEQDGQPYLVMRLMSGGSLRQRLDERGKLTPEETLAILERLAPALDYAHEKGIVHRDLKPENILFDQHGEPFLSDFGIAKLAEAGATLTGDAVIGTPAYMSPEQVRGEAGIDGRSDQYSLGVMLFEMLTGRQPFEANSPTGQMMKHLTAPVPDICEVESNLPPDIQWVIERVLAKNKEDRFESTQALVDELRSVVRSGRVTRSFSRVHASRKTGRQQPAAPQAEGASSGGWWRMAAIGLAVLLSGLGAFFGVQRMMAVRMDGAPTHAAVSAAAQPSATPPPPTSTPRPSDTPPPPPTATPLPTDTALPAAALPQPTATLPPPTPAGPVIGGADKLAFVNAGDVWIANMDGSDARQLTFSGGSKTSLQWSPDGQAVMFITGRCVLSVDIESAQVRTIFCANWSDYLGAFEISPDGRQVAISMSDGFFILSYDLNAISQIQTRQQLDLANKCIAYVDTPAKMVRWSRDGKKLAAVTVVTQSGRQVDMVKIFDVSRCGAPPIRVDEFPGERFTMKRYSISPYLVDFAWNGNDLFALAVNTLNDFGEIYIYNATQKKAEVKAPVGRCCYRGFQWSPDGNYFLFAFQDSRYGKGAQLYYIIYGTIDAGGNLQPIALPAELLLGAKENPQPALRPYNP